MKLDRVKKRVGGDHTFSGSALVGHVLDIPVLIDSMPSIPSFEDQDLLPVEVGDDSERNS